MPNTITVRRAALRFLFVTVLKRPANCWSRNRIFSAVSGKSAF
jgi:hypothetical protein